MFSKSRKIWSLLCSGVNIPKTLLINFRMLPFSEARKLPIWLYGPVDISQCKGKIVWASNFPMRSGQWNIGKSMELIDRKETKIILRKEAKLILGEHGVISAGTIILVDNHATLFIGDQTLIIHSRIVAQESIIIRGKVNISWDSQIFDTNFHYTVNQDGVVKKKTKPIVIDRNVWIGNRVTISKGAQIGQGCVVSNNSLVTHDFSNISNKLLAGSPAKVIHENEEIRRIFSEDEEYSLNEFFMQHKEASLYSYNEET